MIKVRSGLFETNSSSTHTIIIATENDYVRWYNDEVLIYVRDPEGDMSGWKFNQRSGIETDADSDTAYSFWDTSGISFEGMPYDKVEQMKDAYYEYGDVKYEKYANAFYNLHTGYLTRSEFLGVCEGAEEMRVKVDYELHD